MYIIFTLHTRNIGLQRVLISDVDELRRRVVYGKSCCSLNVRLATWRQRLRACVRAGDRHFEYMM